MSTNSRPLPEPYGGMGSSTLKKWIEIHMKMDDESNFTAQQLSNKNVQTETSKEGANGFITTKYPEHWGSPPRAQTKDMSVFFLYMNK